MKLKLFSKPDGLLKPEYKDLLLFKHFSVVKKIGSGSFANVYKVLRNSDQQYYALKHIDIAAVDPSERSDLVSEIRLLSQLDHPNVIELYEAFVDVAPHAGAQLFIVTELMPHGDLASLLERRAEHEDWLPERQVWSYFLQLASGLQYLHHHHVLHRDLKPQNVLISDGGLLKIADLGISEVLNHVFTSVLMGTPAYLAPEMWRRQPYSYSADIWALGCILHELCALRPLFYAETDREIGRKVLSGLLRAIPGRYSADLERLLRLMLAHNPKDRPTIDEIMQLPAVQARLHLLPAELQAHLDRSLHHRRAKVSQLHKVSITPEKWNALLPRAKYASGGAGVLDSLPCLPHTSSCPELAGLGTAAVAAAGEGDEGGAGAGAVAGAESGGEGAESSSEVSAWSRATVGSPTLGGWAAATALKRKSMAVGQLLYLKQKMMLEDAEGAALGPPLADPLPLLRRSRSAADLPRSAPTAAQHAHHAVAVLSRPSRHPAFDPSPLELGVRSREAHGGANEVAHMPHGPAPQPYLALDTHFPHQPFTAPAMPGELCPQFAMLESIPSLAEDELGSPGGSALGSTHGAAAYAAATSSASAGAGSSATASPGGSGHGPGVRSSTGPPVANASARKPKKKVSFGGRLKKLAFGDDDGEGGMHQPLW